MLKREEAKGEKEMVSALEQEEYLYRRAIDIIESAASDLEKEELLFKEVWVPLAEIYRDKTKNEPG